MRERPAGKAFGRVGVQARCMESHLHCSIQWGRQSAALPRETPGARGEYLVSCVYAVRGSRDLVAGACCRSHLQNYHGITLFRAYESPRAGVRGRVVWASRFRGPGMATEECWGAPLHQLVHNPETGDATGSCSLAGRSFFFFFVAREVR